LARAKHRRGICASDFCRNGTGRRD